MPVPRYVDDYVGPERKDNLQHSLSCFTRLTRLLLGTDSVADAKTEFGKRICVLGVDLVINKHGFTCRPSVEKVCMLDVSQHSAALVIFSCRQSGGAKPFSRFWRMAA